MKSKYEDIITTPATPYVKKPKTYDDYLVHAGLKKPDTEKLFKIKIEDKDDPAVNSVSPKSFDILAVFTLTHPQNGDILVAEDAYQVEWVKYGTGVPNAMLEMKTSASGSYVQIGSVTNSGSYIWPSVTGTIETSPESR